MNFAPIERTEDVLRSIVEFLPYLPVVLRSRDRATGGRTESGLPRYLSAERIETGDVLIATTALRTETAVVTHHTDRFDRPEGVPVKSH